MADIDPTEHDVSPTPEKDPDDWITGDEPMTGPSVPTCTLWRRSWARRSPTT